MPGEGMGRTMGLDRRQWTALLGAVVRELNWGLRAVAEEVAGWRARADAIPDPSLRDDALEALDRKRGHADGAALFWTLPARRDRRLLRTLVVYELLQDYLDTTSERGAACGIDNGHRLYRALAHALDPDCPTGDYYRHHPWCDDGGYMRALVDACRWNARALPGFGAARPLLAREAARASVLVLNHEPSTVTRAAGLRAWASVEFPGELELSWYELAAASSGWITTHALLACAAVPNLTPCEIEMVYDAYFPWFALTLTLLDSYVDQEEDARSGAHSYISHFPSEEAAVERLCESVERSARAVLALPNGERHAVLLACMVAMYLTKDSAWTPEMRASTVRIARAGGSLTALLMPVLRAWRVLNGQRAAT